MKYKDVFDKEEEFSVRRALEKQLLKKKVPANTRKKTRK